MAKYRIQVCYETGNSFGSNTETDLIEFSWTDLTVAKENLVRIKEHYSYYCDRNKNYLKGKTEESKKSAQKTSWYVHHQVGTNKYDVLSTEHYDYVFYLKLDNGSEHPFCASMWCGYFERLISAEIIHDPEEDHDMKIYIK